MCRVAKSDNSSSNSSGGGSGSGGGGGGGDGSNSDNDSSNWSSAGFTQMRECRSGGRAGYGGWWDGEGEGWLADGRVWYHAVRGSQAKVKVMQG
ncbi:hypothetical protein GQX73_g2064 [Xylaria multiplex]|uniref:Uncharacterized protein n=1 Tax=Xylaria multiplex TaxID=323545 RepID=A0A7C8MY99_9PEZI|nr:hypothetical protein GQX73_g2064 [Xylaria multiplex]